MKSFRYFFLMSLFALCLLAVSEPASAKSTVKKTVMQYTDQNLTFKKSESVSYECTVKNNDDGYIKVSAGNEGEFYWLMVKAEKPTDKVRPKIVITDQEDGSVVKSYTITVTVAEKIAMKDIRLNIKTSRIITIKNPYNREYKLSYDKKKLSIAQYLYDGDKAMYTVTALKKGTTTVKARIKGKTYGSFKVEAGDFAAGIKKAYKAQALRYNKHIKAYFLVEGGVLDIGEAVENFHADGSYTVKIQDKSIAKARKRKKTDLLPERVEVYSLKTGKTTITVYEQRGKGKKKKIGTIKLTVKKAKDSEVYTANRQLDNDGIFYENELSPGESYDLKAAVVERYVNCKGTGSRFKAGEYIFQATSNAPDIIEVDKNGVCHCKALDSVGNSVKYTITFKDGSTASGGGSFNIVEKEG